ncbi:MAG: hypothetical protein FJZ49_03290 [Candidatus Verstraetearchaeota archaeon]|nr:hypothetical protein [Candidatus Verstraetearchaeota archaeon]
MVQRSGRANHLAIPPHPLALLLSVALAFSLQQFYSYVFVVSVSVPYLLLLNFALNVGKVSLSEPQEVPDSFLLMFAKNLKVLSPEEAFLKTYEATQSKIPALLWVVNRIRDGCPLTQALRTARMPSESDALLFRAVSDLISFSVEETSNRMKSYVGYRQEKRQLRTELSVKMSVLSLRFKILTVISSASLAVIAFTSPLLASLSKAGGYALQGGISDVLRFDPNVFLALLSTSVLSAFLFSKITPSVDGRKLAIISLVVFLCTDLLLVLVIKWRV